MLLPFLNEDLTEAGSDEAGRGSLAGPVFAAAVILPPYFYCEQLNDSKQLSSKERYRLRPIIETNALAWSIGLADVNEIDALNILNASFLAMHRAILRLKIKPQHLLIDGNRFRSIQEIPLYKLPHHKVEQHYFSTYIQAPFTCVVKGDSQYQSIAAASILAKTYRDDYMNQLHEQYPSYHWDKNKGYPTADHQKSLSLYGPTIHHRRSFHLSGGQLSLPFQID
jgi:ribonuclease HII